MSNKIRCIKLSLHDAIIKELILNLSCKRTLGISYEITDGLAEVVVDAFSNDKEGVILIPKRQK
jgi:hypothetical protein